MDCLPQIHTVAYHAERDTQGRRFRSVVPGLGALCRSASNVLAGAGVYRNSIGRTSVYVAAGWQPLRLGELKLGAIAGLITGYEHADMGPMAAGFVSYKHVHVTVVPAFKTKDASTPLVMGLSFTIRF